jgi:TetR/AcrR family transcriptional repressor of nem operon
MADVFVANGYQGTSMQQLAEATGLGKQSLYNAFGDKQAIYLKAVDCAVARFAKIAAEMQHAPSGLSAIERFFECLQALCISPNPAEHTCVVSAGIVEGIEDPLIARRLADKWRGTRELLRKTIQRGQDDGSITQEAPADELADLLMTLMSGLRVSARVIDDPGRLGRIIARSLAPLAKPP